MSHQLQWNGNSGSQNYVIHVWLSTRDGQELSEDDNSTKDSWVCSDLRWSFIQGCPFKAQVGCFATFTSFFQAHILSHIIIIIIPWDKCFYPHFTKMLAETQRDQNDLPKSDNIRVRSQKQAPHFHTVLLISIHMPPCHRNKMKNERWRMFCASLPTKDFKHSGSQYMFGLFFNSNIPKGADTALLRAVTV